MSDWKQHHTAYSACCGQARYGANHRDEPGHDTPYHTFEPIKLASGGVAGPDGYLDCRAAWLCSEHDECVLWQARVDLALDTAAPAVRVATGAFGALLFGTGNQSVTDYGAILWTPKDHGLPCSPFPPPPSGTKVVLVEDVTTTGGTLARMREWCEGRGFEVVGEVVASEVE